MDDRWRIYLWIIGSGGFGAILGTVFGALSGAIYWSSGRTSGTSLGIRLVQSFRRAGQDDLSHTKQGALVGAVDGFVFLGVLGSLAGWFFVWRGWTPGFVLGTVGVTLLGLAAGAAAFGMLGYTLILTGIRGISLVCLGSLSGAILGFRLAALSGLMLGLGIGFMIGTILGLVWLAYVPLERIPEQKDSLDS